MGNSSDFRFKALNDLYERRASIAEQYREQGKKVIGYLCSFAPPELIAAAGMIPCRITGKLGDDILYAHDYVEPLGCPYIRNCFEQDLRGNLGFLDGRIIPHSCDTAQRLYGIWNFYKSAPYTHCVNVPHKVTPWSRDFFQRELLFFKESLEAYAGRTVSDEDLRSAVELYNQNRAMVRELYGLRREQPPRLSGSEMFKLLVVGMTISPEDFNALLKDVLVQIREQPMSGEARPRVFFWGCVIDDAALFEMIEGCGSWVVSDDACIGTKSYFRRVDPSGDLMGGLGRAYFEEFQCPRTDRGPESSRFDYIVDLVRECNAQGVIGYTLSFCDPFKLDYPDLRDYLDKKGIPMLLIDDDYSLSHPESIRTRVEAFLETLEMRPPAADSGGKSG